MYVSEYRYPRNVLKDELAQYFIKTVVREGERKVVDIVYDIDTRYIGNIKIYPPFFDIGAAAEVQFS